MNVIKSLFAVLLAGAMLTACKDTAKESGESHIDTAKSEATAGKIETASFNIEGMTCAMSCAKTIESKLAAMDGVKKATVDFEKKSATVEFDSAKLTPQKLVETVEAVAGGDTYKVTNLRSSGDHAMNKEKKKKKREAKKEEEKKENCSSDKAPKSGCCSAKKATSCHGEKATM